MSLADLRLKFRQSKDYTQAMLVRDLIEYAQEIEARFTSLEEASAEQAAASIQYGTWAPRLVFGALDGDIGVTYTAQTGAYQKIGSLVLVEFSLRISSKGTSAGTAYIADLPFPVNGTPLNMAIGHYQGFALPTNRVLRLLGLGYLDGKAMSLRQAYDAQTSSVSDANILDNAWITASGFYQVTE